ncbi:MAG: hypothetical protein QHJ73_12875 [Armatimonadota bacterium]|nr:hypothetical protein [Armatimonadota bacterium]
MATGTLAGAEVCSFISGEEDSALRGVVKRIEEYIRQERERNGDVAMGCVRLEAKNGFFGIVYEKPGGSSAQYEASYEPGRGFLMMGPDGQPMVETDPDRVFERFRAVIDDIPAQRRAAIAEKLAEWRASGYNGCRLIALIMSFNGHYDGTRGGQLTPEEIRYAVRSATS